MYTHCLFCTVDLGKNESLEHFPVGRRLAFDAAKGRLWVVCRKCERWNLTPLEERWEAIEECERLFRDTRLRVSTDNVGMARLREGLELVRVGAPQRPEFAAWRYGDQFGRRRRRRLVAAGLGLGTIGAYVVGSTAMGFAIGGGWVSVLNSARVILFGHPSDVVTRVRVDERLAKVKRSDLKRVALHRPIGGEGWRLHVPYERSVLHLHGEPALRTLGTLLPHLNRFGASRSGVASAVRRLEDAGGPDAFARRAVEWGAHWGAESGDGFPLAKLHPSDLLALEMALHEESERRAMEGELAALEERWKEAEQIAAIADDMFLPGAVGDRLARLKRRLGGA